MSREQRRAQKRLQSTRPGERTSPPAPRVRNAPSGASSSKSRENRKARLAMLIASVGGSVLGASLGAKWGTGAAILGLILGVLAAAALVFLINAVIILLTSDLKRDPRAVEETASLLAARIAAGIMVVAAVLVVLTPR